MKKQIYIILRCKAKKFYTLFFVMEKDLSINELFDLYGELLTKRQKEIFTSYYVYDLSLSEIAEPYGLTRQCVYESIKKVKAKLSEYESIFHLREKFLALSKIADSIGGELGEKIKDVIGS